MGGPALTVSHFLSRWPSRRTTPTRTRRLTVTVSRSPRRSVTLRCVVSTRSSAVTPVTPLRAPRRPSPPPRRRPPRPHKSPSCPDASLPLSLSLPSPPPEFDSPPLFRLLVGGGHVVRKVNPRYAVSPLDLPLRKPGVGSKDTSEDFFATVVRVRVRVTQMAKSH